MGLQEAIQNIWSSDYVQKNPNKAYKVSYADEYAKVSVYLNGGAEPNWAAFSKLGKGLCEVEKERRGAVVVPPEPPDPVPPEPPPTGAGIPLNGIDDLNVTFVPVNWNNPTRWGGTGGGGVFEAGTPYGKGFRFVATKDMPAMWDAGNNTQTKVCLAQGKPPVFWGQLGKREIWRFHFFMAKQALPDVTHWHAGELWQWHTSSASGHHLSLDPNSGGRFRIGRLSGKTSYEFKYVPIIFDRWVPMEWDIKWSTGADGHIKITLDGIKHVDFSGATDFNDGDRRHQFGWYADRVLTNEITFGGISVERA